MSTFDLSTGSESAQAQNPPDSDQTSPEPKRRKVDYQGGDGNNPNGESEVDGGDKKMEDTDGPAKVYKDTDAFLAYLDSLEDGTIERPKEPPRLILPWEYEEKKCVEETPVHDPNRWVGYYCAVCGKSDLHPTQFCPYFKFFPKDGKLAPNAPVIVVDLLTGEDLEKGCAGRVVFDMKRRP